MDSYPRETHEFVEVDAAFGGVTTTSNVEVTITLDWEERPTNWVAPSVYNGKIGVWTDDPTPTSFPAFCRVWARPEASPEEPVILCGTFRLI